ncbi:Mce-associated membrane protein [Prauserella aidingensis]|uniref:hypothetical protein n=1 Tax=Prauserella aidingensis TaxID=387890 RepID=UPI0020A44581|nr:hypothetical protein [Prauserella aidingensis]MCP2251638.1 Mce-associated membrane protein [Prauserella aidingensis]
MRLPVPAGRKPSPRPRAGVGDPPGDAQDADGVAPSADDAAHTPAVPATVSVTTGTGTAVAEPDDTDTGPREPARSESDSADGDSADGHTVDDDSGDHTGAGESEGRTTTVAALLRPRRVLAALLVLSVLGGLGFAAREFFAQRAEEQARAEALAAAERYAVDLSSYDHKDLDGNFQAVERNATGRFGQQYRQVSDNLTKLLQQHKATSEGNVVRAGVTEADADHAVVLLFVDQTISNTNTEQPRVDRNRMEMTLVHRDDRWLVDKVTLL